MVEDRGVGKNRKENKELFIPLVNGGFGFWVLFLMLAFMWVLMGWDINQE